MITPKRAEQLEFVMRGLVAFTLLPQSLLDEFEQLPDKDRPAFLVKHEAVFFKIVETRERWRKAQAVGAN